MKYIIFLISILISLWVPSLYAADNTCWLSAGQQEDVWVIVYDANEEGDRLGVIWKGKIPAGGKVKVSSTSGHIRYQYKMNPNEGYEGDISTDCYQQITISVD